MNPNRPVQRLIRDSALQETLLVSMLLLLLSGGLSLLGSWLWVLRHALLAPREPRADALLVCGHRLSAGQVSDDYRLRLQRAAELLREGRVRRLILLGGGEPSEAAVGKDWLLAHAGIDDALIDLEEQSADSLENLQQARSLLAPGEAPALLSSRYHLGRLQVFASQLGLPATLIPAEPRFRLSFRLLYRSWVEAAYLCWFISGISWARIARRQHLLQRVR